MVSRARSCSGSIKVDEYLWNDTNDVRTDPQVSARRDALYHEVYKVATDKLNRRFMDSLFDVTGYLED